MNIFNQCYKICLNDRIKLNKHKPILILFTGISGSGKSTLANYVVEKMYIMGYRVIVLDGDNIRLGLSSDLGFSDEDRRENMRRIGEVSKLTVDNGLITILSFIAPTRSGRKLIRDMHDKWAFVEIYCNSSLGVCKSRDVKNLYERSKSGEIKSFTGIDSRYEIPENPDLIINTGEWSIEYSVERVIDFFKE